MKTRQLVIEFDKDDVPFVVYYKINNNKVKDTLVYEGVNVDLDYKGNVVGVEITSFAGLLAVMANIGDDIGENK